MLKRQHWIYFFSLHMTFSHCSGSPPDQAKVFRLTLKPHLVQQLFCMSQTIPWFWGSLRLPTVLCKSFCPRTIPTKHRQAILRFCLVKRHPFSTLILHTSSIHNLGCRASDGERVCGSDSVFQQWEKKRHFKSDHFRGRFVHINVLFETLRVFVSF